MKWNWIKFLNAISEIFRDYKRRELVRTPPPRMRTKLILTIWRRSQLADNWVALADGFDAVSIKCADRDHLFAKDDAPAMAHQAREAGLEVHGWGFHYCESPGVALEEARAAAEGARSIGAVAYHWNAEKQWFNSLAPQESAIAFATTFKEAAPGIELYANCFQAGVTAELSSHFDFIEPMCYGTKVATIASKINKRMTTWPEAPTEKVGWMVGTGRMNGETQAWGYFETDSQDVPGLLELAMKHHPTSINFFRAGMADGEDIMVSSNKFNPTLGDQAKRLRAELSKLRLV